MIYLLAVSVNPSVRLSARPAICPSCVSVCVSVCLSVRPSGRLYVRLSDCMFVCLTVCLSVYLSVSMHVCLSAYLPACLSVCPSVLRSVNRQAGVIPFFFHHTFLFHLSFPNSSSNCGHILNPEKYASSQLEYLILRYPETRTQSTANYHVAPQRIGDQHEHGQENIV